ncbi:hypothetical protein ACP70R_006135 [Stipagrostis hirtigluma subsp. patula]
MYAMASSPAPAPAALPLAAAPPAPAPCTRAHLLLRASRTPPPPRPVSVVRAPHHAPCFRVAPGLVSSVTNSSGRAGLQRCAPKAGGGDGGVHGPAAEALRSAAAGAVRPLVDCFSHVLSLGNILDAEDYHFGMPFGVLVAGMGCYQLFKADPWALLDVVLGCAFYKL